MSPGVLLVKYMQCVNKVGCRLTELKTFIEEDINGMKISQFFTPVGSIAKVQTKVAHR